MYIWTVFPYLEQDVSSGFAWIIIILGVISHLLVIKTEFTDPGIVRREPFHHEILAE